MKQQIDRNIFEPDKNKLDLEWQSQPGLYYEYAEKLADARNDLEKAKFRKDLVEAELDKAIRMMPANYGLEKITETVVERTILLQKSYQKTIHDEQECQHAVNQFQAVVSALEHKKKALESLTFLANSAYFASDTPTLPKGMQKASEAKIEKAFSKKKH